MKKLFIIIFSILCAISFTLAAACSNVNNNNKNYDFNLVTYEISLDVNDSSQIGVIYDGVEKITFESSNSNIVTVDGQGVINGKSEGLAFVTVKIGDNKQVVKVTVSEVVYSVTLDHSSIVIPKGSKYKFSSKPLKNGEYYADDISWSILDKAGNVAVLDNYAIEKDGNSITYTAKEIGDYVVKVSSSKASKICNIKVVTTDAKVLENPLLQFETCKKITWNAVDNATYYNVKVGSNDWVKVSENYFDLTSYVSDALLKDGETLKIEVKANAEGKYDYLDSYISSTKLSHTYSSEVKEQGTCTQAGIKEYTCSSCNNVYEDEYYAHEYVQGFCKHCKDTYTDSVTYGFDDNFIPMPSPEDAANAESSWRKKYDKYIRQYNESEIGNLTNNSLEGVNFERKECYLIIGGKLKTFKLKTTYTDGWTDSKTYYEVLWHLANINKESIPENEREVCYYVSGVGDGRATEIYLSGYFDDGRHGYHEVKYIKQKAFMNNNVLTKVELAENISEMRGSCFYNCLTIQTVIAPGITFLPQSTDYMKGYYHDNFTNAYGMRKLVLGDGVYIDGRNFHPYNYANKYERRMLDIYVNGSTEASMAYFWEIQPSHWDIFSGNYYYRDDIEDGYVCNTWSYDENGNIVRNYHEYTSNGINFFCKNCEQVLKCGEEYYDYNGDIKVREHDYGTSEEKCVYCGAIDPKGLIYQYDDSVNGYAVVGYEYVSSVLRVPEKYDDGRNGLKDVKYIGKKAFKGNSVITHVILPETVSYLAGSCFESMPNLIFVSMTGVSELPYDEHQNVNQFVDCFKLETVIIKKDFNIQTQCFIDNPVDGISCVGFTIYAYEPSGQISFVNVGGKGINNMWNNKVLYYDSDLSKCGSWRLAEGGLRIETNATSPVDANGDGYCDHSNCAGLVVDRTKALVYYFDDEAKEYHVIKNKDLAIENVVVPEKFNDGVHGEYPVTTIGKSAFEGNTIVKSVILAQSVKTLKDSAFSSMPNLKYISMLGVSAITSDDGINQFVDDTELEFVVIKKDLTVSGQSFYDRADKTPEFSIYALESGGAISIPTSKNNNMWNNELYIYTTGDVSRCYSWKYDTDGKTIIKSTSTPIDEDGDGYCDHSACGGVIVDVTKAIFYGYDETTESYFVTKNAALAPATDQNDYVVLEVASEFDDGVHGKHPVTAVGNSAFEYNGKITHVVLPESVTRICQFAFVAMPKLQTVIMPGVSEVKTQNEDKQFHGSINLKKIVVGQNFDVSRMILNLDSVDHQKSSYQNQITIYSTRIGGSVQINNWDGRNDGWNNKLVYCWEYETDTFEPVELSNHKYLGEDGVCEFCDKPVEKTTLATYAWEEASSSYIISNDDKMTFLGDDESGKDYNGNGISTAVRIPSWYNDGVHGDARVTAVGVQAFESNHKLTAIALPETVTNIHALAFNDCKVLKTVKMTGVTSLTDKNDDRQFRSCASLRTVIVGQNFNATRRFLKINEYEYNYDANTPKEYDDRVTIYSTTIGGSIWLTKEYKARNSAWNGEICYCWEYEADTFEPVKLDTHKYVGDDGSCEHCNQIFHATGTPNYKWDDTTNSYYVSGDGMTFGNDENGHPVPTDIVIPSWHNDGVHGDARVTRVAPGALNTNSKVTSIKLPSTVTTLGALCFANMSNLKTVIMTGALNLTSETSGNGKFFEGSTNLVNLVLGPNVFVADGVYLVRRSSTPTSTLNVFCTDDSGEELGTARGDGKRNLYLPYSYNYDKNESIGGKIFYYYRATKAEYDSLDASKQTNAWRYDDDGFTPIRWADYLAK